MSPLNFNANHRFGFVPFDWMRATFVSLKDKILGRDIYTQEIEKSEYVEQGSVKGKLYQFPESKLNTALEASYPAIVREMPATYYQSQTGTLRLFLERWNPFPTESQKQCRAMANQLIQDALETDFLATQSEQVIQIIESEDPVAIAALRSRLEFFKAAFMPVRYIESESFAENRDEVTVYLNHIIETMPMLEMLKAFLLTLSISNLKDDHVLLTTLVSRLYLYSQATAVFDTRYAKGLRDMIESHFRVAFMNEYS